MKTSYYRLIWLLPIAFVAHIIDEYVTGFPAYAGEISGHAMELPLFLAGNITFIAVMLLLVRWAAKARSATANFWVLAWAAGNQFWNFIFHFVLVLAFDRNSPGLVTGTLIYFPLSLALWQAARAERIVHPATLIGAILLGGVFMGAVAAINIFHVGGL
ncbi:MAG: HXXEE domain-containing protein [Pseudomonadota bacterium]